MVFRGILAQYQGCLLHQESYRAMQIRQKSLFILCAGVVLVCVWFVVHVITSTSVASTQPIEGTAINAPAAAQPLFAGDRTPTIAWYVDLPPDKRALIEAQERAQAQALQTALARATPGAAPETLPTVEVPPFETQPIEQLGQRLGNGVLIEHGRINPPARNFATQNFWIAQVDGQEIQVYAGHFSDDPAQGALIVRWIARSDTVTPKRGGYYYTPQRSGAVRVLGIQDGKLLLTSAENDQLLFDPLTGTFQPLAPMPTTLPATVTTKPYPAP